MERQTRQLLLILGDDLTDELIGELSRGERLETDLQQQLAGSRQTIARRLGELELWGIVVGREHRTPGRGRPTRLWRLSNTAVTRFLAQADELLLGMLEERAQRHREAIRPSAEEGRVAQLQPRSSA